MTDTESFDYNTQFTPARPKKKRKNKTGLVPILPQVALERTIQELTTGGWMLECTRRSPLLPSLPENAHQNNFNPVFSELVRETASSIFSYLSNPRRIICLGLGSPSSSRDARAQLAFLLELCDSIFIVCSLSLYRRSLVMASVFMCS